MAEPSSVSRPTVDWEWLGIIADEMDTSIKEGRWTEAEYRRVLKLARKATGGNDSFCEFVLNQARPEWT